MKFFINIDCLGTYVAVSLRAGRLSSRQKINLSETWHTKRVSYTTNKNEKIFWKYLLSTFLEARTHFGSNQAIFHPFQGRNLAIFTT